MRWSNSRREFPSFRPIHARQRADSVQPHADVLRHAQIRKKSGLLVDACDTEPVRDSRSEMRNALPGDIDRAAIRLVCAGDDLDERRFARAILAEQRMHFARPQIERHALERTHRAEGFGDGGELEKRGFHYTTEIFISNRGVTRAQIRKAALALPQDFPINASQRDGNRYGVPVGLLP